MSAQRFEQNGRISASVGLPQIGQRRAEIWGDAAPAGASGFRSGATAQDLLFCEARRNAKPFSAVKAD
jgi:hypothetical protein